MTNPQRTTWNFYSAGHLVFGSGAIRQLPQHLARIPSDRVLIVTDAQLAGAGLVDRVRSPLLESGRTVEVFDGGEPEPSLAVAEAAVRHARNFKPDAILGLGGGSNMDLAKITAILYTHGGRFSDYFGYDNVPGPLCPLGLRAHDRRHGQRSLPRRRADRHPKPNEDQHAQPVFKAHARGGRSRTHADLPARRDRRQRHRCFDPRHRSLHRRRSYGTRRLRGRRLALRRQNPVGRLSRRESDRPHRRASGESRP